MPLKPGSSKAVVSQNIRELHTGKTYAHTAGKFGKDKANKQAVAIALSTARKYRADGGRANETKPAHLGPGYLSRMAFGGLPAPKPPGLQKPVALGAPFKPAKADLNPSEGIERLALRGSAYGLRREGMINSSIPGRTDKLPMNVKAGSYVLPADIPSALGQGNSMAGGQILKKMFSSGPYGLPTMKPAGHVNMPRMNFAKPPSIGMSNRYNTQFASGGKPKGPKTDPNAPLNPLDPATHLGTPQIPFSGGSSRSQSGRYEYDPDNPDLGGYEHARGGTNHEQSGEESVDHVPIIAAGGEFIIDPSVVRHIGHGDIKAGHRVLDKFVLSTRKKHIQTLRSLKPPKK